MAEQPRAKREQEVLAEPRRQVVAAERDDAADGAQRDVERRDPDHGPQVSGDEDVVDRELEHPDLCRVDDRYERDEDRGQGESTAESTKVRPEPPHDVANRHVSGRPHERPSVVRRLEQIP